MENGVGGNIGLGDKVRDKVTGYEGIVTGLGRWITGCDSASVVAPSKDGKPGESQWCDVNRLEVVEAGAVSIDNAHTRSNGGPTPDGAKSRG